MISVHDSYKHCGVDKFYNDHAEDYINHHSKAIFKHLDSYHELIKNGSNILDLCSGDGLVTKYLSSKYPDIEFTGVDPYLYQRYNSETQFHCFDYNFKYLAQNQINQKFDLIICSFALHLCPSDLLPSVLFQLSLISDKLLILSPHKKPDISHYWQLDSKLLIDKVHSKLYLSKISI